MSRRQPPPDVNRAVSRRGGRHPAWATLEPSARAKLVRKLAQKLREGADAMLRIEVMDTGNTISKMRADVAERRRNARFLRRFATEIKGETIPASGKNRILLCAKPYGVVGRIIPFQSSDQICGQCACRAADGPAIASC